MIKQTFSVRKYWEVIVFYDLDYNFFYDIANEMEAVGAGNEDIEEVYKRMHSRSAKAVTYSNTVMHVSIVVFNPHSSKKDYINSIVHEAEHVKQAMLQAYEVEDSGESPAYTIGYLVGRMYGVFNHILCNTSSTLHSY